MTDFALIWRQGRAARAARVSKPRTSVLGLLVAYLAQHAPAWQRVRTAVLAFLGFGFIDYGLWSWHLIAGCVGVGVSLLLWEALGGKR